MCIYLTVFKVFIWFFIHLIFLFHFILHFNFIVFYFCFKSILIRSYFEIAFNIIVDFVTLTWNICGYLIKCFLIAPYHMVHRRSIRQHPKQIPLVHRKHSFRTRLVISIRCRLFHVQPWAKGNCCNHHFVWSIHPTVKPISSSYCYRHDMSYPHFSYVMYMAN